jgi:hypothetical protein
MKKLILVSFFLAACGGSVDSTEVTSVSDVEACDAGTHEPDGAVFDPCANPPCEDGGRGIVTVDGMQLQCMCPKR